MSTFLDGWNPLDWTLLDRIRFALTVPFIILFLYFLVAFWIPDFFSWILEWRFAGFPEIVISADQAAIIFAIIGTCAFFSWIGPLILEELEDLQ